MKPMVHKALERRKGFAWGIDADKVTSRKISKRPKVAYKIGDAVSVIYKTKKKGPGGQYFIHDFAEDWGKRPELVADVDNDRLHLVGGDYSITDDGIIN